MDTNPSFKQKNYQNRPALKQMNMGGELVFIEPNDLGKAKKDPNVWRIICRGELDRFIEACIVGSDRKLE